MSVTTKQISEAFSGHRVTETYEHLAPDVRCALLDHGAIEGKDAASSTARARSRPSRRTPSSWMPETACQALKG